MFAFGSEYSSVLVTAGLISRPVFALILFSFLVTHFLKRIGESAFTFLSILICLFLHSLQKHESGEREMSKIFDFDTSGREREREWRERNVKNPLEVLIRDSFCFSPHRIFVITSLALCQNEMVYKQERERMYINYHTHTFIKLPNTINV